MTGVLELASQIAPASVWIFFAIFARIGAACALLPAFGEQVVPARIKLAIALAFSALVAPLVWEDMSRMTSSASSYFLIGAETVTGLAIGIFFRMIVVALQVAGAVAAQSTSLSQIFGAGLGAEPQPAFSTLLVVAGLALAASLGLHVQMTQALVWSYQIFPAGEFPNPAALAEWGIGQISYVFALGFTLAAPFVIASVIYNFGLGVINKAMPQLMVAFVGAPAISFGGLVLLLVASPLLLSFWASSFERILDFNSPRF